MQSLEDVELSDLLMISAGIVPAEDIQEELDVVGFVTNSEHDVDLLQDFEELNTNGGLATLTTAHQSIKVMD